jgi:NAD(P)-dependent dehydrogenase (short-subunit alcohol dehydrogenase family)
MLPKRSDTAQRGFFGDLTAGFFSGDSAGWTAQPLAQTAAAILTPMFDYARAPFPQRQHKWPAAGAGKRVDAPPQPTASAEQRCGRLLGRRALVTGGDSDIGRAAAIAFAAEGADVAFNYLPREQSEADDVARHIRQAGRKAVLLPGDLRDEKICNQLVTQAVRELGGLDILVSNATRQHAIADIAEMSTEQFDATFKGNIYAMFWLTKAALPHMGPGSSIINTSSATSCDPSEILLDYSATKGAIMVFTKSLAKQLASRGIRVNAVAPEPIWTPLATADDPPAGKAAEVEAGDSTKRCGRQAELASTYVLLASDESSYATGQLYGAVGGS